MEAVGDALLGAAGAAACGFVTVLMTSQVRLRVERRPWLSVLVMVATGGLGALFWGIFGALAGLFFSFLGTNRWLFVTIGAALPVCYLVAFWASVWFSHTSPRT
jgi:hypothetical protein